MINKSLPWRVLVVEDEEPKIKQMEKVLESLNLPYDSARSANDARVFMRQRGYHLLSLDQQIPEIIDERTNMTSGADLDKECQRLLPLARKVFYTAQMSLNEPFIKEVKEATMLAGQLPAQIWHKSATDNPAEDKYTSIGWARALVKHLEQQYLPYYLLSGKDFLPVPLARCCADLNNKLGLIMQDIDEPRKIQVSKSNWPYVAERWLRFYEDCLLLSLVQAHCWLQSKPWSALTNDSANLVQALQRCCYVGAVGTELRSWLDYIQPSFGSTELLLVEQHEDRLAWLKCGIEEKNYWNYSKFLELMLPVLDIASFWCTRPLVARLRKLNDDKYQATRVCGATWPYPQEQFELNDSNNSLNLTEDSVYLSLPVPGSNKRNLVNLWPWLRLRSYSDRNFQSKLEVCLRPSSKTLDTWIYRNLETGEITQWQPDPEGLASELLSTSQSREQ